MDAGKRMTGLTWGSVDVEIPHQSSLGSRPPEQKTGTSDYVTVRRMGISAFLRLLTTATWIARKMLSAILPTREDFNGLASTRGRLKV